MNTNKKSVLFAITLIFMISGQIRANNMIKIVAHASQVIEMPVYQEQEVYETIPGAATKGICCTSGQDKSYDDLLNPETLTRILICITKPEIEEPFPFQVN